MITIQRCNALNYGLNNQFRVSKNIQQMLQPASKPVKSIAKNSSDSVFSIIVKALSNIF